MSKRRTPLYETIENTIMYTFILAVITLVLGFVVYGTFVEKVFGIHPSASTPATTKTDGVDYVPMHPARIFLVQFLNIAGLGPIFGAIMGIFYGSSAFLWIVFGTIFAGGVHDYLSGMLSLRKGGATLPDIVGDELGLFIRRLLLIISVVLLVLLTTVFLSGPATLLQGLFPLHIWHSMPIIWVIIIFAYYVLATLLPVDKLIGRFYPIFGGLLLFMGLGIMVVMLGWHSSDIPEVFSGLGNRQTNNLPLFPMMFVSIACGAISGFHATQSPIMARCVTSERQGRWIFYGAMTAEGLLALIWAAAAGTFFAPGASDGIAGLQHFASINTGKNVAALVVDTVSNNWLGTIGGLLAVIGVIVAPITSGDTALRSARLIVADWLHIPQKEGYKRLYIALPLFACVFAMLFIDFDIVWRYFSWTNQLLSTFTLWAGTIFLYKERHYPYGYLISLIPALFMTMVCYSYIFIAPEGIHLVNRTGAYCIATLVTITYLTAFCLWTRRVKR